MTCIDLDDYIGIDSEASLHRVFGQQSDYLQHEKSDPLR